MLRVLASHERALVGSDRVLVSFNCTDSSAFTGLSDAQGQIGRGDDLDKVHEVVRALGRVLFSVVEGVILVAHSAGELGAEAQ